MYHKSMQKYYPSPLRVRVRQCFGTTYHLLNPVKSLLYFFCYYLNYEVETFVIVSSILLETEALRST
jgi:hypothetical protein